MFSRESSSQIRSRFFTRFGKYMAPVPFAGGEKNSWINYKTGIKSIFIRIDTAADDVSIGFQIGHPDAMVRQMYYNRFLDLQPLFAEIVGPDFTWSRQYSSGEGQVVSRIYDRLENTTVLNESNWPDIISFLKPRLVALDNFWWQVSDQFE